MEYRITWEIDVDARSFRDAAAEALRKLAFKPVKESAEDVAERLSSTTVKSAGKVVAHEAVPETGVNATRAMLRGLPRETLDMAARHGDDGYKLLARHPGAGERLLANLGDDDVLRYVHGLSTDPAIVLARHSNAIAKLPPTTRTQVLEAFAGRPNQVCSYLRRNPAALSSVASVARAAVFTTGAVTAYAMSRDHLFGKPQQDSKPGSDRSNGGFIDRTLTRVANVWRTPVALFLGALGVLMLVPRLCTAYVHIRRACRAGRCAGTRDH